MNTPTETQKTETPMSTFAQLPLSPELLASIETLGYTTPSPIQAAALPLLLGADTDFLGLAATGTGKTAAFAIPMLEKINTKEKTIQALVLCPTRELAQQVAGQIALLGKNKMVKTAVIFGGGSYNDQFYALKQGAQVVIATPGRLVDHIKRGTIKFEHLKIVILDEADEMISMGFKDDLEDILRDVDKSKTQTWMFSATMSKEVRRVADDHLKSPKLVQINKTEMLSSTVEQIYYFTKEGNKPEILTRIIDMAPEFYGIVFCQTKVLVQDVTQLLIDKGYKVDCLHGDKDQSSRERTMRAFTSRKVNILICTDVASRGLDVKDITHVVNYSIPRELDSYVHRIGRTARSGKSGIAISLVTGSHMQLIPRIERMTKSKMKEGMAPTRKDIGMKKVDAFAKLFADQSNFQMAIDLISPDWKTALAAMTPEEVAGRFLAIKFPDIFPDKNAAPAMEARSEQREERRDERPERREEGRRDYRPRGQDSFRRGPSAPRSFDRDSKPSYDRGPRRDFAPRADFAPRTDFAPRSEPRSDYRSEPRAESRPDSRPAYNSEAPRPSFPRRDFGPRKEFTPRREFAPRGDFTPRNDFAPRNDSRPEGAAAPRRRGPFTPTRTPDSLPPRPRY